MWRISLGLALFVVPASVLGQTAEPIPRTQFIAQMDSQFRQMDADKNGQITRAEIEQYQEQLALTEAKTRNRAQFAELDTNKNGQLSAAEFAKLTPPTAAANAGPMLAREDSNRDSQISLIEHRAATLANFDRLDTDRNGIVTAAEMKAGGIR
jgi:Ca2+-binding EF-hand superfamily protein